MTHCESKYKQPVDWQFLITGWLNCENKAEPLSRPEHSQAREWVEGPVGQLSAVIPRGQYGIPLDPTLVDLGQAFGEAVADQDYLTALHLLPAIRSRGYKIIEVMMLESQVRLEALTEALAATNRFATV